MEYIHDFLLTNTQTHISFGFSFSVLIFYTDVQALLIEIGSRLVVVEVFKLFGHSSILFKTSINILTSIVVLSANEIVTELKQGIFGLLELFLLNSA